MPGPSLNFLIKPKIKIKITKIIGKKRGGGGGIVKVGVSKKVVFTRISAHISVSNKSIF
jgi:hypothetical protein